MAIDYSKGYAAHWRVFGVDTRTWADSDEVGGFVSASVDRTRDGMCESGSFQVEREPGEGFAERYCRLVMTAEQDGQVERVDVCTMLCAAQSGEADYGRDLVELDGRSVLWPADARKVLAGTYVPKGADGARWAGDLLAEACACPVHVEGAFALGANYVLDLGTSALDAAWDVLAAGGFCIQVDGRGEVHVLPEPTAAALQLDREGARMLMPGVRHELDMGGIPNRYVADADGASATAVNEDPASPTSTVSRGYFVDEVDRSPKPLEGETLAAYARRKLAEASVAEDSRRYEREFAVGVHPWDVVSANLPEAGMAGDFRIKRQSLEIGRGIAVTEEAAQEVVTWQA